MTKKLTKVVALACSLSLMAMPSMTALASEPMTTAGTANILDYSLDTYTVPTSVKVALNPKKYTVTKKAAVAAANAEYEVDGDVTAENFAEKKADLFKDNAGTPVGDDPFDGDATYYKLKTAAVEAADAVTTTDQIVTFNYGLANFGTAAQDVTVTLKATGTKTSGKTPITFVDDVKKAQAYNEETNATGAKVDELKMYMAVVAAKEQPKVDASTPFAVTAVTGGTNTHNVTAAALADVSMENATNNAGAQVFAAGEDTYAETQIAFKLDKAIYNVQDDQTVDFTTTQASLAEKMEITTLGGITGFTFIGTMNEDADWTKADVTSLSFTPTYKVEKADGEESAAGGYKQIKSAAAIAADAAATAAAAAAEAAAGFKSDHTIALKTAAEITYEDLDDIEAAITAFGELSNDAKALLADNDPAITASTLNALKAAAEALAITDEEGSLQYVAGAGAWYVGKTATAGLSDASFDIDSVTMKKGNGDAVDVSSIATVAEYANTYWIAIDYAEGAELGLSYASGASFEVVATVGQTRYTATVQY